MKSKPSSFFKKGPTKKEIRIRRQVKEIEAYVDLAAKNPNQLHYTINQAFMGEEWNDAKARYQESIIQEGVVLLNKFIEEHPQLVAEANAKKAEAEDEPKEGESLQFKIVK